MHLPSTWPSTLMFVFSILAHLKKASTTITVDQATCNPAGKSTIVQDALTEALDMAKNVGSSPTTTDPRTHSLFQSLLGIDLEYKSAAVQSVTNVLTYNSNSVPLQIYCGDDFIQQVTTGPFAGHWYDYRDPQTPVLVLSIGNALDNFNCSSSGYLAYALLPSSIILCDRAFGRLDGQDTIGSLRGQTLQNEPLDKYNVLSGTILHELTHIAGAGSVIDAPVLMPDGSQPPAYGYQRCINLALLNMNGAAQAAANADTLTLLAIGLYMTNTQFTYGIGQTVEMDDVPTLPDFSAVGTTPKRIRRLAREARFRSA